MSDAPTLDEDHDDGVQPDPRLSLLLRASTKFYLVEHGLEELDEAFDVVARACRAISPCHCHVELLRAWAKQDRETARRRRWRPAASPAWPKRRP
jgi:hypothetical protein